MSLNVLAHSGVAQGDGSFSSPARSPPTRGGTVGRHPNLPASDQEKDCLAITGRWRYRVRQSTHHHAAPIADFVRKVNRHPLLSAACRLPS
jgi:hypothetical protein